MTANLAFKQSSDLNPALINPANSQLKGATLLGRWLNTNRDTTGIAECAVSQEGEHFTVSIFGVGEGKLIAWPKATVTALANLEEEGGQRTAALAVDFDFGFMRAETYIRVNKGVLVIVLSITFTDDSGRSSYVNREFFYRQN